MALLSASQASINIADLSLVNSAEIFFTNTTNFAIKSYVCAKRLQNFVSCLTNVQFNHIALNESSLFFGLTCIMLKLCTVFVGYAVIQYGTAASAIYAKYKLHGFEYPPGNRLTVTFLEDGNDSSE